MINASAGFCLPVYMSSFKNLHLTIIRRTVFFRTHQGKCYSLFDINALKYKYVGSNVVKRNSIN